MNCDTTTMDALLPISNDIEIEMNTNDTPDNERDPSSGGDQQIHENHNDKDQTRNGNQSLLLSDDYCENELEIDGKLMLTDSDDNDPDDNPNPEHIESTNKGGNGNIMNVNSDSDHIESSFNKDRKMKQKKFNIIDSDSSSMDGDDNNNDENQMLSNKINTDDYDQDKILPPLIKDKSNEDESKGNDVCDRAPNESKSSTDNLSENSESSLSSSSIIKNRKKKKFTKRKVRQAFDQSSGDNDSENDGITNKLNTICDNDSTSDENDAEDGLDQRSGPTNKSIISIGSDEINKKRPEIRMSAKQAMDQMKLIKSESQRMARERQISVPYHQPKQYTLKEFLTRRNGKKTTLENPIVNDKKHLKAAAAIKMSKIELEKYGKLLEERAKDAEEFFKSDDDDKHEVNDNDEHDDDDGDDKDYNYKEDVGVKDITHKEDIPDDVVIDKDEVDKHTVENTEIVTESNKPDDLLKNTSEFTSTDEIIELMDCGNKDGDKNDNTQNDIISMDITLPQLNEENSDEIITNLMDINNHVQINNDDDKLEEISLKQHNNDKELINTNGNSNCEELQSTVVNEIPTIDHILNDHESNPNTIENENVPSIPIAKPPSIKELIQSMANEKIPKLRGSPNTIIDLESGVVLPKTNAGVDKLFDKYLKHTTKLLTVSDELLLSVSETQKNGFPEVECKTKLVFIDSTDPSNRRNPKSIQPGKSIQKLKDELRKKMSQQRNEAYLQKLKAIQKLKKESNSESDENSDNEKCGEKINDCTVKELINDELCNGLDDNGIKNKVDDTETLEKDIDEDEEDDNNGDDNNDDDNEDEEDNEVFIDYDDDENINENNKQDDSEYSNDSDSSGSDPTTANDKTDGNKLKRIIVNLDDSDSDDDLEMIKLTEIGLNTKNRNVESNEPTTKKQTVSESIELFSCASFDDADRLENDLYEPASNCDIGESQLMDLCSGTFETQLPSTSKPQDDGVLNDVAKETDQVNKFTGKKILDSSSEDEGDDMIKEKKSKKNKIYLSDEDDDDNVQIGNKKLNDNKGEENDKESDEDDDGDDNEDDDDDDEKETNKENETEQGDNYLIDYDSEENEIEVPKNVGNDKKSKRMRVSEYLENEAELSESEWGSEDEDEQNLDKLDVELGDEEEFDKEQLASELGRIHMRRMLDQDAREVKLIKDILLEDEEKDGIGRERQFKWKNIDNSMNIDDLNGGGGGGDADGGLLMGEPGDDENEEQWRRMRYEREQLLAKEKDEDLNNIKLTDTNIETLSGSKVKKFSIIKSSHNTPQNSPSIENHFLISSEKDVQKKSIRGSFLSRDQETLTKLAYLTKNVAGDGVDGPIAQLTVAVNKAKNFSFSIRAIDKDEKNEETIKRKNESVNEELTEMSSGMMNPQKKPKISIYNKSIYSKKSLFDQIN